MKSIIIILVLLVAGSTVSIAQCDKKVSLSSSQTQHLDASGALKNAEDEKTTVVFDKSDITVTIVKNDGSDQKLTGKVKSVVCNWGKPFKEGKTALSVTLNNEGGESRDFAITIEGKDGKIVFLAESKEEPDDKIKLDIDKFEEKN